MNNLLVTFCLHFTRTYSKSLDPTIPRTIFSSTIISAKKISCKYSDILRKVEKMARIATFILLGTLVFQPSLLGWKHSTFHLVSRGGGLSHIKWTPPKMDPLELIFLKKIGTWNCFFRYKVEIYGPPMKRFDHVEHIFQRTVKKTWTPWTLVCKG